MATVRASSLLLRAAVSRGGVLIADAGGGALAGLPRSMGAARAANGGAAALSAAPTLPPLAPASRPYHATRPPCSQLNTSSVEDVVRDAPPPAATTSGVGPDPFLASPDVRAAPPNSPLGLYAARRAAGLYRRDARQEAAARALHGVWEGLRAAVAAGALRGGGRAGPAPAPAPAPPRRSGMTLMDAMDGDGGGFGGGDSWAPTTTAASPSGGGWLSTLFGSGGEAPPTGPRSPLTPPAGTPTGLYMYGGVGTGKTMLMDLFVEAAGGLVPVRRVHFNDFMLDVHARLRSASREPDPLGRVAADLVSAAPVLALDELFVTDVADAAILARLFAGLWAGGLVLVATSNRPPADLYKGGLQRDLFLPFIDGLVRHAAPLDLASAVDYRRLAHAARGLYFCPPDWPTAEAGSAELRARFAEVAAAPGCHPLAGGGVGDGPAPPPAPATVPVMMGRTLAVPLASGAAAYFPFQALCGAALGAADYIALARAFHTLALDGVPAFTAASAPAAARFITLVDVLYEHRVRTFVSAAATPSALFANVLSRSAAAALTSRAGGGKLPDGAWVDDNLAFAMERTISRLTEMQTLTYLVAHARAHAPVLLLALEEQQARAASVAERRNVSV